eukprot:s1779_g2.t1
MSWYSKRSSQWWQETSSTAEWREKGSADAWNADQKGSAWTGRRKDDWKGQGDPAQSKSKGDWKGSGPEWSKAKGEWRGDSRYGRGEWRSHDTWKSKDWKAEKADRTGQRHQWVAKSEKPPPESINPSRPQVDPAMELEGALAEVEELLGERLESTRELLEHSHQSSREAVSLMTYALELLTKLTQNCKGQEDLNNVMRAKDALREMLMWRNFGSKMWLHNKPDPMNFETYDVEVQADLRQTWTKIEQKLMQELIAGDSWGKLARKLRFCVANQDFSGEMRTLLTRICNVNEATKKARQKKNAHDASIDAMSEKELAVEAVFEEMAADDAFGEEVIRAVRNDQFRHQEAFYPAYAHGASPAWMQQMLGWQLALDDLPHGQLPQPMPAPVAPAAPGPQMLELSGAHGAVGSGVHPWAEPWAPWQWNNFSTASSSGAPAPDLPMSELQ